MKICMECGEVFSDEEIIRDHIPGSRYEPPEDDFYAPCGHEELEEAERCRYCNEWYAPGLMSEVDGMCEFCFAAGAKEILHLVEANGSTAATAIYSFLRGA